MALDLRASAPPLDVDQHGVARVRGTRIALEVVVDAFSNGASAEEIALRYPTLQLSDVYAVLSYVLHDPAGIAEYMTARAEHADRVGDALPSAMIRLRERLAARAGER